MFFNFVAALTICSDFGAPQNKVSHCFLCFPIYLPWSDGQDTMILVFWMLSFKPTFSLSFSSIKRLFSYLFSDIRVVSSTLKKKSEYAYLFFLMLGCRYSSNNSWTVSIWVFFSIFFLSCKIWVRLAMRLGVSVNLEACAYGQTVLDGNHLNATLNNNLLCLCFVTL